MKPTKLMAIFLVIALMLTGCTTGKGSEESANTSTEQNVSTEAESSGEKESSADAESSQEKEASTGAEFSQEKEATVEITCTVTEDKKYGAAELILSEEEFEAAGFQLGDSVDITFSNGYTVQDVPYYNGYYVNYGAPVLVAYPGMEHLAATYNSQGLWVRAALSEGDTVTITLNEAGKNSDVQETLGQVYSFDRTTYESDEQFCNFRAMTGGNLKENFLFRGASPVDNSRSRASYTDGLLEKNGIKSVVDLADTADNIAAFQAKDDFTSSYWQSLYESEDVVLLGMSSAFQSDVFHEKLAEGMRAMMASDGPVYIHCMEGKDRTGFVCMVLEALAGASYDEMLSDYMLTYSNYYSVTETETPEKYQAIATLYFDAFASYLHGTEDLEQLKTADYTADAEAYLKAGGMTEEEIQQLKKFITKE